MKRIIINADDFGLNDHCSAAIAEAFDRGLVTDTTMMATGAYFDRAVTLAKERGFFDRIGIHFNLTEGVPLTGEIRALPRFATDGRFNKRYDRRKPLTKAEKAAIYTELSAQADQLEGAGIRITHADSHHHIHTGVYIAPIVERVCREHGIDRIRLYRDMRALPFCKRMSMRRYNTRIRKQGFTTADHFAYVMDIDGFDVPDRTEILVHPDYDRDGRLIDRRGMTDGCPVGHPIPRYADAEDITLSGYAELP